jgi:AraC family transcriptional regulator of adaptative response / DNA-3-methyladenine glycosylase II
MALDAAVCYRALRARDRRFDGRFFVGVTSTRIYCRPICTAKLPKRENCRFFAHAAAAEAQGFRPCLRCRPELAPGNSSVDAGRRIAHVTAAALEEDAFEDEGLETIAKRQGVTSRHLRRVFAAEFGVSPVAYAQTRRLLLSKRLLTDTRMSVTDVAFAAGFKSVRRFNALFKERYRLRPLDLRNQTQLAGIAPDALVFDLSFRPPYDWDALLAFFATRTIAGVEDVGDGTYRRSVRLFRNGVAHAGWIEIARVVKKFALRITVSSSLRGAIAPLLGRVNHLMDLCANPGEIAAALGDLAKGNPGLRLPGAFDGFEVAVRAVLGQQVSVAAARTLAGRFAARFGSAIETPFEGVVRVFPSAGDLRDAGVDDVASLGIVGARARTILVLAKAIAAGELMLVPGGDVGAALVALRAVPGVGEWTAQYVVMRAMAWPDAFPHTDLGIIKALDHLPPKRILAVGETWRPWRSYAVMHLWKSLA